VSVATTPRLASKVYHKLQDNISRFRKLVKRPLTLGEKILVGHFYEMDSINEHGLQSQKTYVLLSPDRVALQDVTGQMTILEFMQSGLKRTRLPTTVHCDHLIQARVGSDLDTKAALYENNEIFQFLESACRKYGIGF
jgi:aconitate hydratase